MVVRMVHPVHGATHAYDIGEKVRLEGLGWAEEVVAEALPDAEPHSENVAYTTGETHTLGLKAEEFKRGPGRPPKAK